MIFYSFSAFAQGEFLEPIPSKKAIIISDIDDTIKISHVRNPSMKILRGFYAYDVFVGMNYLYHTLGSQFRRSNFYYVSAALKSLSFYWHSKTLEYAGVPTGEMFLRENQEKKEFKLSALRKILAFNTTKRVFLFGDNAEYDSIVYDQIQKEYPHRKFYIFIRKAYPDGNPIMPGQEEFLTPLDVAVSLYEKKVFSFEKLKWLIDRILFLAHTDVQESEGTNFLPEYSRPDGFPLKKYLSRYQEILNSNSLCSFYFY